MNQTFIFLKFLSNSIKSTLWPWWSNKVGKLALGGKLGNQKASGMEKLSRNSRNHKSRAKGRFWISRGASSNVLGVTVPLVQIGLTFWPKSGKRARSPPCPRLRRPQNIRSVARRTAVLWFIVLQPQYVKKFNPISDANKANNGGSWNFGGSGGGWMVV